MKEEMFDELIEAIVGLVAVGTRVDALVLAQVDLLVALQLARVDERFVARGTHETP